MWWPHQVEQVLETYFMNLDNTYNKLQTLNEYIDDTEDYVRFEIDTQRNRFIEVDPLPSLATVLRHNYHCVGDQENERGSQIKK